MRFWLAPAGVGVGLIVASVAMELTDFGLSAELWVSTAAGAMFLGAVPFIRGNDDEILTGRARLLVGAGSAAVIAVMGLWRVTGQAQPAVLLLLFPALLLFVTAVIAIREAGHTSHARRVSQLRSRFQGEESERRRWAQELHDETLQDLAAIELRLAGLTGGHDPEALSHGVQDARIMVREQIRTLRHLITQLRPLALDTLGLAAALADLARRAEDAGSALVHCDLTDLSDLPAGLDPEAQVAIYRIVQEALTNAVHHSAGRTITLRGGTADGVLEFTVRDDGIGLPVDRDRVHPGFGLNGMRERALAINAQLTWATPPGGGTLVTLRAPVPG